MPLDASVNYVVDMTNVKDSSGINPVHQPAGDYRGVIKDLQDGLSKQNNKKLDVLIADADRPSATYRYTCTFTEQSLFKLRNLLIAAGMNAPKKKVKLTAAVLNKLIGREVGMSLDDDEYEGKMRSTIVGVFPADDLPEDEPAPKATKKSTKKADPEPAADDDEDEDEEDLDELDIDDL